MALTGSGAITLDAMHVEAGGTTGDECTINDTDIIGLIGKTAGATMAFNEWYGASGEFYSFPITNSCCFNAADTPYFNFTPSSAGNLRTWTWSGWIKKNIKEFHTVFAATTELNSGNSAAQISYYNSDIYILDYSYSGSVQNYAFITDEKHRDTSAWMHIVFALDTTQATEGNRAKLYVNGVQVTSFSTETYPARNYDGQINTTLKHFYGNGYASQTVGNNFDGYLADANLIDGTALTPSSFGELKNNIWVPKDTDGLTFGDQGHRLEFKQVGTGTAGSSTIGADTSGEGNHWTSNALAVHDFMIDSPTNNFSTLNPLMVDPTYPLTHLEGNLKSVQTNKYFGGCSSIVMSKNIGGKWYFEASSIVAGRFPIISVAQLGRPSPSTGNNVATPILANSTGIHTMEYSYHGYDGGRRGPANASAGSLRDNNTYRHEANWGSTFDTDVLSVALDMDNMKVYFGKNGTWQGSGNPAGNASPAFSSLDDRDYVFWLSDGSGAANKLHTWIANFGQNGTMSGTKTAAGEQDDNDIGDFLYDVPAGFLALCTANLPDPVAAIDPAEGGSPQDYFSADIFTGNGTNQDIDIGFVPNLVWTKQRTDNSGGAWMDSVRGTDAYFQTANNNAEGDFADITFTSSGYKVTGNDNLNNENAHNYVGWAWKAESAFSNDASSTSVGTIDSTGRVNTDVGISIVTYTGNGTAGASIAHGLGAEPKWIIAKRRNASGHWRVQHGELTYIRYMSLDNTGESGGDIAGVWHRAPTTAVFSVGQDGPNVNNGLYVAYSFAEVPGFSRFSSYTGSGNVDGPFIYCGFRPAFTIIKREDAADRSWIIQDHARSLFNPIIIESDADLAGKDYESDASGGYNIDYLSNGIKIRTTNVNWNADGGRYIVMAFAAQPFKYANAR